ncbi:hypothetical protein MVEN_01845000 [Mycena venus]|uniref:Uncharacterized protein n=1 Tax=Mycena venus TaxID=2733690 RepID=A0A8H6XH79_9AGAR|nr:hypothetical protein MVEN_01845000 [Mycena venus]
MTELWYYVSEMWIGTFFYGIYLVLFCICIYILLHRPRNLANTILLVTAISLFTLSTVQTIINIITGAGDVDGVLSDETYGQLFYADNMIYVANKLLSQTRCSQIYRCYVIWNRNIYVVILPIIMVVVTIVFGVDQALPLAPFFGITLATNVLVTGLTAGRIWWMGRQVRAHLQPDMQKKYTTSMSIIVESGVIYSAGILTYLVLGAIPFTVPAQEPTTVMLAQLCGIVPTLLIVRVGLGASVQSVENAISAATVLDSNVHSRSRPHILGVRSDISRPYDVEKNIPCSDSYGDGKPQSF